jgi:hypothetical protein
LAHRPKLELEGMNQANGWSWLEWPQLWLFLRAGEQARLDGLARKLAAGEFTP